MIPSPLRRHAPAALALGGCVLLAVAEFTDLYSIRAITVTLDSATAGSHHGYALLVIAIAAAAMAFGATTGGSRPAAAALAILAAAALAIALAIDLPAVNDTGLFGRDYEQASAQAEIGFKLETAGAIALCIAAAWILILRRPAQQPRRRTSPSCEAASDSA